MNKKIIWGVVVVVTIMVGFYLYQINTTTDGYIKGSDSISEWKTYTSQNSDYSIKYPNNFKITLGDNGFSISNPENETKMAMDNWPVLTVTISKQPLKDSSKTFTDVADYVKSTFGNAKDLKVKNIAVGNIMGAEITGSYFSEFSGNDREFNKMIAIKDNLIYEVNYDKDYPFFEQIAKSFELNFPNNFKCSNGTHWDVKVNGCKMDIPQSTNDVIVVSYPNGGEVLKVGDNVDISWIDNGDFSNVVIYAVSPNDPGQGTNISGNISVKASSLDGTRIFTWKVGNIYPFKDANGRTIPQYPINPGKYAIEICRTDKQIICDKSGSDFTIIK